MSDADERLVVMLEARITEFERRMKQAESRGTKTYTGLQGRSRSATRAMERDMVNATTRINQALATGSAQIGQYSRAFLGGLAGGALAAGLAGVSAMAKAAISDLAKIGDEAKRAGLSVEAFQEWKFVAEQNRIGIDQMVDGLKELNLRADEFVVTGKGPAAEAFARIGMGSDDLAKALKDPSDLMLEIIDRMKDLDKAGQIRVADEIFGGSAGERFVELLGQGRDGIASTMQQARDLGVVLDESLIAKAQQIDAKYNALWGSLEAGAQRLVISLAENIGLLNDIDAMLQGQQRAAGLLGDDLRNALEGDPGALDRAKEQVEDLAYTYDALQTAVVAAARAIGDEVPNLVDIGADELAMELADVTSEMELLISQVQSGKVPADQLEGAMSDLIARAGEALAEAEKIDGLDLSNAVGAVDRVSTALVGAIGYAQAAVDKMRELAGMGEVGGDDGPIGPMQPGWEKTDAPSTRPQRPGIDSLGDWEAVNTPKATGGGRKSKGNNRLDALLEELQTEREILTEWYDLALEDLQGATDAQLEAVGGRHEALERLETEHQERLREIKDQANGGALANAETFFGAMATLTAAAGERSVKAARIFGAAEALINTYRAQALVLADPTVPFWGKFAAVAAIGAAGFGMVAAIKGGGGGGGGGASVSGGTAAAASSTAATSAPPDPTRLLIEPINPKAIFTGQALIDLVDGIKKEFGNQGLVIGVRK